MAKKIENVKLTKKGLMGLGVSAEEAEIMLEARIQLQAKAEEAGLRRALRSSKTISEILGEFPSLGDRKAKDLFSPATTAAPVAKKRGGGRRTKEQVEAAQAAMTAVVLNVLSDEDVHKRGDFTLPPEASAADLNAAIASLLEDGTITKDGEKAKTVYTLA